MPKKQKLSFSDLKSRDHVLVYSTDPQPEKPCQKCGKVEAECHCSLQGLESISLNPAARIEKKGRGGKSVTVLFRLPASDLFLKELCSYLKRSIGSGGTHYLKDDDGFVEIQGEWQKQVIDLAKAFKFKAKA